MTRRTDCGHTADDMEEVNRVETFDGTTLVVFECPDCHAVNRTPKDKLPGQ